MKKLMAGDTRQDLRDEQSLIRSEQNPTFSVSDRKGGWKNLPIKKTGKIFRNKCPNLADYPWLMWVYV